MDEEQPPSLPPEYWRNRLADALAAVGGSDVRRTSQLPFWGETRWGWPGGYGFLPAKDSVVAETFPLNALMMAIRSKGGAARGTAGKSMPRAPEWDAAMAAHLERNQPTMAGYHIDGTRAAGGGMLHRTQVPVDPGITGGAVSRAKPGEFNWMDFGAFSKYPEVAGSAHGLAKNPGVVSASNPAPARGGMSWPPANAPEAMLYYKAEMEQARLRELRKLLEVIRGKKD